MGIEIDLNNLNLSDNAELMRHIEFKGKNDVHIGFRDSTISGNAKVLDNLRIDTTLNELMQQAQVMDKNSAEYLQIKEILSVKQWNKADFTRCVMKHISEFSQGVLASIVANFLTK